MYLNVVCRLDHKFPITLILFSMTQSEDSMEYLQRYIELFEHM